MTNEIFNNIAKVFSNLPKKIISNKSHNYLTDCVLYEISQEFCFHFNEVAYFVYNPDFHLCKGMAGIKKNEISSCCEDPWENLNEFEAIIKMTKYNQKIKEMQFCTLFSEKDVDRIVKEIEKSIDARSKKYYSWQLPNNNIGILLYESAKEENEESKKIYEEQIENAGGLLGFCPIQ